MSIDALKAAEAYAAVAGAAPTAPNAAQSTTGGADFGGLVQDAISDAAQTLRGADDAAASVAAGEAGLVDVVTAVSSAEVTLEAAIAIRNRVIEAYQEIMRMPI